MSNKYVFGYEYHDFRSHPCKGFDKILTNNTLVETYSLAFNFKFIFLKFQSKSLRK